jgi:hypothetical protein
MLHQHITFHSTLFLELLLHGIATLGLLALIWGTPVWRPKWLLTSLLLVARSRCRPHHWPAASPLLKLLGLQQRPLQQHRGPFNCCQLTCG